MDSEPKPEPGPPPLVASRGDVGDDKELMNMSMELTSKVRAAIDAKAHLKGEVEKMKKEVYLLQESRKFVEWDKRKVDEELEEECEKRKEAEERLEAAKKKKEEDGVTICELRSTICGLEEELEKCNEQREKGKRAEERYEKWLEAAKKEEQEDEFIIAELKSKNSKLEEELKRCKEKCAKGKKAEERYEKWLEAAKKKEREDGDMIAELKIKNSELEEKLKNRKEQCAKGKKAEERYEELLESAKKKEQEDEDVISELRRKIHKLEDEKLEVEEYWKKKYMELKERVLKLQKYIELLKSAGETSNGTHTHARQSGKKNADSTHRQRNGDTGACNASGMGMLEASVLATLI